MIAKLNCWQQNIGGNIPLPRPPIINNCDIKLDRVRSPPMMKIETFSITVSPYFSREQVAVLFMSTNKNKKE